MALTMSESYGYFHQRSRFHFETSAETGSRAELDKILSEDKLCKLIQRGAGGRFR